MKNFDDVKKSLEAKRMLMDLMERLALESDDAPKDMKLKIQIMSAFRKLTDTTHKHIDKYINPDNPCTDIELLTSILEYIKLVEAGINRFFAETEGVEK